MNRKNTRRGFTLIELLVVVIIIGVLAAIALPQYQKAVKKSRVAEAKIIVKSIWNAVQRKNLEMGTHNQAYKLQDLDVSFTDANGNAATGVSVQTKNWLYVAEGGSISSGILHVYAVPTNRDRDGNYFLEINENSDEKFVCWTDSDPDSCSLALPGAQQVERNGYCSSGDYCYIE